MTSPFPFFITGTPRSGTTLLSILLNNHPRVYIDESSVGRRMVLCFEKYRHYFALDPLADGREVFSKILEKDNRGDIRAVVNPEQVGEFQNLRTLFSESVRQHAAAHGKEIWGDKTPPLINHIPQVLSLFPEARFIHVVRDGRSNAYSLHKRQYMDLRLAAQKWKEENAHALAYRHLLGGEFFKIVFYEDMLREPEKTLRDICYFLKIEFTPAMLDPAQNQAVLDSQSYVKPEIDATKIDEWKNLLSKRQVRQVESIAGDLFQVLGYPLSSGLEPRAARSLKYGTRLWLAQKDLFRNLFRRKRVQMIRRKLKPVTLSIPTLIKNFAAGSLALWWSEQVVQSFARFLKKKYE